MKKGPSCTLPAGLHILTLACLSGIPTGPYFSLGVAPLKFMFAGAESICQRASWAPSLGSARLMLCAFLLRVCPCSADMLPYESEELDSRDRYRLQLALSTVTAPFRTCRSEQDAGDPQSSQEHLRRVWETAAALPKQAAGVGCSMGTVWESPARKDVFGKHFWEASYIRPWHETGLGKV